ncbi:hypothetical protein CBM2609_U10064 [Cupriavidus taiwanensis]|nr:hypothetical protein CBM2609_U10064 [Cupriavidus taiwanensis]
MIAALKVLGWPPRPKSQALAPGCMAFHRRYGGVSDPPWPVASRGGEAVELLPDSSLRRRESRYFHAVYLLRITSVIGSK